MPTSLIGKVVLGLLAPLEFNRLWACRFLLSPLVVLLITDGLARESVTQMEVEMARLALESCGFISLNQLIRWNELSPQAAGI